MKNLIPILFLIIFNNNVFSQCWQMVWSDEFEGTSLDDSKWDYGIGTSNDNVQYYTDRNNNVTVSDGKLKIIALQESYQGFNYTSGLIKTAFISSWRYGRVEAKIKLPYSPGFVPAFWMLPEDNIYGWWPNSGEIDIMEHPTNEINKIYGTVHTEAYNSFTGSGPRGETITITDAETAYHIYAIEWNENQIEFYVDDQKYFTFYNDNSGYSTWPFNQKFNLILNLAVGGAWVGNPNSNTVFPAIMEVDYVRIFQNITDVDISGPDYIMENEKNVRYTLPLINNTSYSWGVPAGNELVSGQGTNNILTDWGIIGGNIQADIQLGSCFKSIGYPVIVSPNNLLNANFEKGVKYWDKAVGYPAVADFILADDDVKEGIHSVKVDVKTLSNYPWDIQLSQKNLALQAGVTYNISLWAKVKQNTGKITISLINPSNFSVYTSSNVTLTSSWVKYDLSFKPTTNINASLNIDLGTQTGIYYLDNFMITAPSQINNPIVNYDFSNDTTAWALTVLFPAVATGDVVNEEYKISINNGGVNAWDVFLGQGNILIEKGKEYLVSFDAYAEAPRTISALVGMNLSPWTVYSGNNIFSLSTSKQTFTYSFIMNNTTDTKARIGFDAGGSTNDVYLDNIYLMPKTTSLTDDFISDLCFALHQNYPNPFNNSTVIRYSIPKEGLVTLKIYNVIGQEVAKIIKEEKAVGNYEVNFNASNLPSGVYIYKLQAGSFFESKKMILLK